MPQVTHPYFCQINNCLYSSSSGEVKRIVHNYIFFKSIAIILNKVCLFLEKNQRALKPVFIYISILFEVNNFTCMLKSSHHIYKPNQQHF